MGVVGREEVEGSRVKCRGALARLTGRQSEVAQQKRRRYPFTGSTRFHAADRFMCWVTVRVACIQWLGFDEFSG